MRSKINTNGIKDRETELLGTHIGEKGTGLVGGDLLKIQRRHEQEEFWVNWPTIGCR
jgi:hypothetical protein